MSDLHEQGWQLHIAGSVTEEVKSLKYLLELIKSSEGLPIFLHFNASFDELKRLYNQATIYWHATGYGSQADEYPERQEHFGISTVEAMSAHAIPVVIDSAGQKEIVNEADNGFLWQTQPELEAKSRAVVAMTAQQRTALSDSARTTSKKFNGEAFAKRVREIFGAYL
jgi:glycosyltransferase involved in cell wall biosynthesis